MSSSVCLIAVIAVTWFILNFVRDRRARGVVVLAGAVGLVATHVAYSDQFPRLLTAGLFLFVITWGITGFALLIGPPAMRLVPWLR